MESSMQVPRHLRGLQQSESSEQDVPLFEQHDDAQVPEQHESEPQQSPFT